MKTLSALIVIGAVGGLGYVTLKHHEALARLERSLDRAFEQPHTTTPTSRPEFTTTSADVKSTQWSDIQSETRDAVVQIFSFIAQFNWLEPYTTPKQGQATGSGFFIDNDGHIVTNAHVVDEAKALFIQVPSLGKMRFEAKILGVSPERDLALLEVTPQDLAVLKEALGTIKYLEIGNSDNVQRADEIMALGYPLGQQSLKSTTGVVSGFEHINGHYFIQIDAPINPGSSGGPSVDRNGVVVGVNSAGIFGGGVQNAGYIVPSNAVRLFLKQLDHVEPNQDGIKLLRKPFLGVLFNNATPALVEYLGNPPPGGLYVVETYKGSPLHKAGVQSGDMIYSINNYPIDIFGELDIPWSQDKMSIVDFVGRLMVGDTIDLVVYRDGKRKNVSFSFDQSELAPIRAIYSAYEKIEYETIGGLVVMQLALNHLPLFLQTMPELARYMELKNQLEPALIITHIFPDSVAARTRSLSTGAIISEVNGKPVKTLQEFRSAVRLGAKNKVLTIKTSENAFAVLPYEEITRNEQRLADTYYFRVSPLVRDL